MAGIVRSVVCCRCGRNPCAAVIASAAVIAGAADVAGATDVCGQQFAVDPGGGDFNSEGAVGAGVEGKAPVCGELLEIQDIQGPVFAFA